MKRTHLLLLVLFGGMVTGAAFAQGTDPLMSFPQWASSPALFVLGLIALVKILREKTFSFVDGKLGVFTFAAILGALIGAAFQWFDWLAVAPFTEWSTPLGGVAYGVAAAVAGFLGVNLFDMLSQRRAEDESVALTRAGLAVNRAAQPPAVQPASFAGESLNPQTAIEFLLNLVRSQFGNNAPPLVWGIVETLIKEFAGQALNDKVRKQIQHRFLDLLAAAGAPGRDS